VLVVAGCGGTSTATLSSNDAAVVGSKQVTKDQFQSLMDRAKTSYVAQKRPFPKPGRTENEQLKKQFYGGSETRYEKTLKQQGLTQDQAKEEVRAQLISEALFKKVTGNVKVSKDEIKAYYNSHKSQYGQPQTRDVRHILVTKKALADSIYAQLKAGANFAKLAKKYSKDPGSASNGGKLTISKGQTVPAFDKTAFSLKKGELSPPIHTQYGYHIIQALSDVKAAQTTSLDKVESSIKQQLESQRKNDVMTKWVDNKKKSFCKSGIKYQVGYQPNPDPCATLTGATTTTTQ